MAEIDYGITPKGPNIKRLDVIIDEMHDYLSKEYGVNTKQYPETFLNHIITNFADQLASLWELGEQNYFSMYPTTAEGISLDNATQFGGSIRENAKKSYYPIHCTGKDGSKVLSGSIISSKTNPTTYLSIDEDKEISRSSFNKATVKVVTVELNEEYDVILNGDTFAYKSDAKNTSVSDILNGLKEVIEYDDFSCTVDEENELLIIEAVDLSSSNVLNLTENLTTENVTSIITFGTVETGDIKLPNASITNIVKAEATLLDVINLTGYIAGRKEETDQELRKSYIDKIFIRSNRMTESLESAILSNIQGVESVKAYENYTNVTDTDGRPPHSVEVVVEGGDPKEIAKQILETKAAGINTHGAIEVEIPGVYGEEQNIRFNKPEKIYVWYQLKLHLNRREYLPTNHLDLLKTAILTEMNNLKVGDSVIPQSFISSLYKVCSGISYIDYGLHTTSEKITESDIEEYTEKSREITFRQRAFTDESMIEVVFDEQV